MFLFILCVIFYKLWKLSNKNLYEKKKRNSLVYCEKVWILVKWTILYVFFIDYWHLAFGFYFFLLKLFSSRESILFTEVINLIMLLPAFCLLFANGFCQITKPTLNTKAIVRPKCLNKSNIHTLALVRLNEIERQATHAHTVENDHRVNQMICTRV